MITARTHPSRTARLVAGCVFLWALLARATLIPAGTTTAAPADPYPQTARSYVLIRDGVTLWERQGTQRLPPASLTKLLTALVLLDNDWQPERWLPVSPAAATTPPTRLGLRAGEQVRADDALAAMLIHSANDACRVLVETSGVTRAAFTERMNTRAEQLGMRDSHFVDPCGFDADGQYSTVRDLLKLAQQARGVAELARLTGSSGGALHTRAGRELTFQNTNQLLGRLDGTLGVKTGYTSSAGQCLIAYVRRGSHDVWLVMLGGSQRWWLAHGMINDAFAALPAV